VNIAQRSSGVQLHITSLPGGRLGPEAYRFIDWLAAAGQSWWQVLPLGPPDRYRSPYKSASAFAAWRGLLGEPRAAVSAAEIADFRERESFWIGDWERFSGAGAVADQVRFEREWAALRAYGAERGVRIMGDVAIYVSSGSADHRAHPELFRDDAVAGAPPDAYATEGQLWGNPLYDWPALQRRRYVWWVQRVRRTLELQAFGINIVDIGAGEQIPEHDEIGRDQEEIFFVLAGDPTLVIDGEDHPAPAGTFARLDPEHKRTMRNDTRDPAEVLIVSAPRSSGYEPMEWA